ncbi:hypothetical protein QI349_02725 [Staphylococcus saprophyticus]|nr:hypothetical protein [Staphylococcus saprophyticus]
MLVNYSKLIWISDEVKQLANEKTERIGLYQLPNLAIYLYIDLETHKVLTVEFDYEDQPELLEKDIPRDTTEHVYEWLRSEGYIYGKL